MQHEFLGLCELRAPELRGALCVWGGCALANSSHRLVVLLILLHESVIQQKEVLGEGR